MSDDLIERLEMMRWFLTDPRPRATVDDAITEIKKLTAERDLLEKDAQRYRWLRDSGDAGCIAPHTYWERGCSGETLDEYIDAALDHANRDE
jgi:hypothetical protein